MCSSAGEALPGEIGQRFERHFGCAIVDGIGSTEMLHVFLSNRPGDIRYGTTGKPVAGYEIELRGDDGRPVADGEVGDLFIKGPSAALMYWGNREKSRETFQGGWTKSGDKYVRDADGYYTYSGRSDDMLKVSGIWVSPFEVEATLMQHPAVLECAVIGTEDGEGLTKTKAFVVVKPGAAVERRRAQGLRQGKARAYKYPRAIEFVDELPKTATGKIQRFRLRERERAARRRRLSDGCSTGHGRGSTRRGRSRARSVERECARAAVGVGGAARSSSSCTKASARSRCGATFRARSARANGLAGFVFSRYGYGRSTPKPPDERWAPDFMHRAGERGPAARSFAAVGIERPWLFGHSDGALDRAAACRAPSGRRRRRGRAAPVRRGRLDRQHREGARGLRVRRPAPRPREATTTTPTRRSAAGTTSGSRRRSATGTSSARSRTIDCPVLAVQGDDDEYGTLEQVRSIARRVARRDAARARATAATRRTATSPSC